MQAGFVPGAHTGAGWGCFSYPFLFYGIILVALRYAFLWLLKLLVKIAIVSVGSGHTVWCGVVWCAC